MSSFDKALANAQNSVPDCVAVGFVDLESGMLLGARTVDNHPTEVLDLVAAATADLFQGPTVVEIENIWKEARGRARDSQHYFKDIVVFSENLLHVFLRGKSNASYVAVFVCRGSANVGMVLSKSRLALAPLEQAL